MLLTCGIWVWIFAYFIQENHSGYQGDSCEVYEKKIGILLGPGLPIAVIPLADLSTPAYIENDIYAGGQKGQTEKDGYNKQNQLVVIIVALASPVEWRTE